MGLKRRTKRDHILIYYSRSLLARHIARIVFCSETACKLINTRRRRLWLEGP
jgi:hypothetical protein